MDARCDPYFISTAIPYVNGRPHIGHAMELALTDALARSHRLWGDDVWFQTGADENSLKNVLAAEREGIAVRDLVNRNSGEFQALANSLESSYDGFLRTSVEPRHTAGVTRLWRACARSGDIYKSGYRGLYCVGCEQFYKEGELAAGLCPEHLSPPEVVEEENYFFRLSRYADQLHDLIVNDRLRIEPLSRKNETLRFIAGGLHDLSISRSQARAHGWGIPTPDDPGQVIYVWFDALANYITALDYAEDGPRYRRFWQENPRRVHVVGKGILRFHAVYWPAFLLSAGLPLPTTILVHGYLTVEGQKISKSLGNTVDPSELVQTYGADAVRYYLLRHTSVAEDSDFGRSRLVHAYNSELADQLGNLLSRTVAMAARYCDGAIPAPAGPTAADRGLASLADGLEVRVREAMERFAPAEALAAIWEVIAAANKYVVEVAPWTLARARDAGDATAGERLATTLYHLIETLRLVAVFCQPFIPQAAARLAAQLGLDVSAAEQSRRWGGCRPGARVAPGPALFPKG